MKKLNRRFSGRCIRSAVVALSLLICVQTAAVADMITWLGPMSGYTNNAPAGVGVIGGVPAVAGEGDTPGMRAFYWTQSSGFVPIEYLPGGTTSAALAVSSDGLTVVGESGSTPGAQAFYWTSAGGMQGLGDLDGGGYGSAARGVSSDGLVIVGSGQSLHGSEAFRWQSNTMTGLGFLTASGPGVTSTAFGVSGNGAKVVGWSTNASGNEEAFLWVSNVMMGLGDLAGGTNRSVAYGISSDGLVIVGDSDSSSGQEAFRYERGTMSGLGDLDGGSFASSAKAVSGDGSIIVGYGHTEDGQIAFIWDDVHGMRNLQAFLTDCGADLTDRTLLSATGISADGRWISGYGTNPSGNVEGWVVDMNATPEPCSFILAALTLGGAMMVRRRRSCEPL